MYRKHYGHHHHHCHHLNKCYCGFCYDCGKYVAVYPPYNPWAVPYQPHPNWGIGTTNQIQQTQTHIMNDSSKHSNHSHGFDIV